MTENITARTPINEKGHSCFDYAMVLNLSGYRFECRCGSSNCRSVITGEDWKQPELQHRYAGCFQWYLQEKINGFTQSPQRTIK